MNSTLEIFFNVAGVVLWLTVLPALWISRRILLRNSLTADRFTYIVLWLILAGFFRIPLVDLLSILVNGIAQSIPLDPNAGEIPVSSGITVGIVRLLLYALGIYLAQRTINRQNTPWLDKLTLSPLEKGFVVLGMAGLFYHLLADLVGNFILLTFS